VTGFPAAANALLAKADSLQGVAQTGQFVRTPV
jgi:hypothetical protein